jgi:hypothetical protein
LYAAKSKAFPNLPTSSAGDVSISIPKAACKSR